MKKYIKPFCMFTLGFFTEGISILQDIYPCGCGLLCALGGSPFLPYSFLGVLFGGILLKKTFLPQNILPCILILPFILLLRKLKAKRYAYTAAVVFVYILIAYALKLTLENRITLIFTGLFSACLLPLFTRLYISFNELKGRFSLENADIASLCLLGALAISSLPKFAVFGFDIRIFAILLSSSVVISAFDITGSVWTTLCAVLWLIKGGDYTVAFCLICGGMLAGFLSRKRGGILLGFTFGDFTVSLFLLRTPYLSLGIVNLILGCGLQIFVNRSVTERLKRLCGVCSGVHDLEMSYIEGLRSSQKSRIENAAGMYSELARSFTQAGRDDSFRNSLIESGKNVCRACRKREYCLSCREADTVAELAEAADTIINTESLSSLPLSLAARCIQPMEIVASMNDTFGLLNVAQAENTETELSLQLKSVSDMLFSLADSVSELPVFDNELEKQVFNVLQSRIGSVEQIHCRKLENSVRITVSLKQNRRGIANEICAALKDGVLGVYTCIECGSNKIGGFIGTFAPMPKFAVDVFACRKQKNGESVCGDSFTYYPIEGENFVAALSDGAGSGKRAATESESTLNLLEAFSAAHVKRGEMFKAMNSLLLLKGDKESYSTVDVAELDLQTGLLYWTKIGAVPGYVLRGGNVEKIEAGALPMGIVTGIAPATAKMLIKNGDIIVLVTDGIYDGLCRGKEDKISDILLSIPEKAPQPIAETILESAAASNIDDDMTVLVLKISA